MSSGYFSVGFESLQTVSLLSRELRSKLALILDPPLESDWKVLADKFGLTHEDIKWIDSRKNLSPTEILFNYLETIDGPQNRFSLPKLSEILQKIGRDDAFEIVTAEMSKKKETEVWFLTSVELPQKATFYTNRSSGEKPFKAFKSLRYNLFSKLRFLAKDLNNADG